MTRKKLLPFDYHLIILFFILLITFSLRAQNETIQYTLTLKENNEIFIRCDFDFGQSKEDSLYIIFPNEFGGNLNLFDHIKKIKPLTQDLVLIPTNRKNEFSCKLKTTNASHLSFCYSVKLEHAKVVSNNFYEPFSRSNNVQLIGSALFAYPSTVVDTTTFKVFLKGDVNEPTLYSTNCKSIICANSFKIRGIKKLKESLNLFVDAMPINMNTEELPILLFMPEVSNTKDYIQTIKMATTFVSKYWHGEALSPYLMNITIFDSTDQGISYKGTCFDGGITFGFTENIGTNSVLLKHLLIHELCHNWIGIKLYPKYSETNFLWFTEGFTEFFTWEVMLENNWVSKKEYVKHYNKSIQTIYLSEYRNTKYKKLVSNFRSDVEAYQTLYAMGNLFAFIINNNIQKIDSSNSLKKIILEIIEQNEIPFPLTDTLLAKHIDFAMKSTSFQNYLDRYIYKGNDMIMPTCLLKNEYCTDSLMLGKFQLGFEMNDATNIVTEVVEKSAAFNAGLRKGAEILENSIYYNEIDLPVKLKVNYQNKIQNIEFVPQSLNKVSVPVYIKNK